MKELHSKTAGAPVVVAASATATSIATAAPTSSPAITLTPTRSATPTATASAESIKEEFITQRMKAWLVSAQDVRPHEYLTRFFSLNVDGSIIPEANNTIVVSYEGKYKLIHLDADPATDPQLRQRSELLERWAANPANKHTMVEIEQLLEREIGENILWFTRDDVETISTLEILGRVSKQFNRPI